MSRSTNGLACAVLLAGLVAAGPALADRHVYQYRIVHHTYGDVGTYINTVEQNGDSTEVKTELHVAVKFLGIVMYRQDAERLERWQGDRLASFHGVTVTNGDTLEVDGEARGDHFVITSPSGTVLAPANIRPTNPRSAMLFDSDVMMSTKTGKLMHVNVTGGGEATVTLGGAEMRLRQYEIDSDKRDFVWLDDRGVPVAFRTEERGTPIDFILTQQIASR
jgi:hypothetical protein